MARYETIPPDFSDTAPYSDGSFFDDLFPLGGEELQLLTQQCIPPQGHNAMGPFTSVVEPSVSAYQEGF